MQIKCTHPPRAKIGQAIRCEYTITNLTEEILSVQVRMDDDSSSFLFAGEQLSQVNLMPCEDTYTLTYTLVPVKLGMQTLPSFFISKAQPKSEKDTRPQRDFFWLKNYTSKVFVSSV